MYERVLLTLDGSQLAEDARMHAVTVAKQFGADLYVLRVIEPLARSYRGGSVPPSALQRVEEQLHQMALEYLEGVAEEMREQGVTVRVHTRSGTPVKEIMQFVQEHDVGMIVMCSCGEGGLARWLLGSVADHVLRGATVPVLVVPPRRTESIA
jgi:nucleotide-binding universal stress UspA family protein